MEVAARLKNGSARYLAERMDRIKWRMGILWNAPCFEEVQEQA